MNHTMGRLSLVLLGVGISCLVAFRSFGSHVDSNGVLLAGAGAATGVVAIVRRQPPRQP